MAVLRQAAAVVLVLTTSPASLAQQGPGFPAAAGDQSYPPPRYPRVAEITSVEQLLSYARHIVTRPMPYSGDQRVGFGLKGGERVLFVNDSNIDPLVLATFLRVLRDELKCHVDVFERQGGKRQLDTGQMMKLIVDSEPATWMLGGPAGIEEVAKAGQYDKVIGYVHFWDETNLRRKDYGFSMDWPTREQLASPAVTYPEEVIEAIDRTAWRILRQCQSVRITDPQGTDIRFTWFPEYWKIMEGDFPEYNTKGFGTTRYRRGALEDPVTSGHLAGYPLGVVLPKSDVHGVIAGTADHLGPYAHLKIYLEQSKVTRMEGGGLFGAKWRDFITKYKDIKFPHSSGPGVDWFIEAAIGTHPKIARAFNVFHSSTSRSTFALERDRAGLMHLGIGQMLDFVWALRHVPPLPFYHFHVNLYFPTYTCEFADGREVTLIDKGHLTALDDVDVRKVAAKYGNPDELLRVDWIPAIPGINAPGNYLEDFAADPERYMKREQEMIYKAAIERSLKLYK